MNNHSVRLKSIHIKNFKNVQNGYIDLYNEKNGTSDSILALYGQNGSGKTALIEALHLFQQIARGREVSKEFSEQINVDSDNASFVFNFLIEGGGSGEIYDVSYECKICKKLLDDAQGDVGSIEKKQHLIIVYDECVSFSYKNNKIRKSKEKQIDTETDEVFVPKAKYRRFVGSQKEFLLASKKIARRESRSFIFSNDLSKAIREKISGENFENEESKRILFVLMRLKRYAIQELFVVTTRETGLVNLNLLPLIFKHKNEKSTVSGLIALNLNGSVLIAKKLVCFIQDILQNMNIVLKTIVPGLKISLKTLGEQLLENGEAGVFVEIISEKNNKPIALRYESDGIKKIITILHLLIMVYNQKSITVAIDELDSGVFEYLLGELMRIFSDKGKGQLVFTSHNLRPLETIDYGSIVFTTTDPGKRYVRLKNAREAGNLRDFYFRNIVLGKDEPSLYQTTNTSEISLAFINAGFDI